MTEMNTQDRAEWNQIVDECRHVLTGRKAHLIVLANDDLVALKDAVCALCDIICLSNVVTWSKAGHLNAAASWEKIAIDAIEKYSGVHG
jgi:hypothetical protein